MGTVGNRKEYEPVLLLQSSRLILETPKGRTEQRVIRNGKLWYAESQSPNFKMQIIEAWVGD